MNSHERKILRDHAKKAGHLVSLWDASDFAWYKKYKYPTKKYKYPTKKEK